MSPSGGGDDRSMCVAMAGMLSLRNRFEEDDNTSCTTQYQHVTIITIILPLSRGLMSAVCSILMDQLPCNVMTDGLPHYVALN